jgi:hypothetical protein
MTNNPRKERFGFCFWFGGFLVIGGLCAAALGWESATDGGLLLFVLGAFQTFIGALTVYADLSS